MIDWIEEHFGKLLVGLFATIIVGGFAGTYWYTHATTESQTCTVEDKDRASQEGGSSFRIYTDCGVFKVQDSFTRGMFSSADRYAAIEVGETYEITTYGWRIPFMSAFPNIIEAKEK